MVTVLPTSTVVFLKSCIEQKRSAIKELNINAVDQRNVRPWLVLVLERSAWSTSRWETRLIMKNHLLE